MLSQLSLEIRNKQITRIEHEKVSKTDLIVIEEPLEINLSYIQNGKLKYKTISITMRTPGDDENLVRGFLFTEGIVKTLSQILIILNLDLIAMPNRSNNKL